jgi:hypothetical protein
MLARSLADTHMQSNKNKHQGTWDSLKLAMSAPLPPLLEPYLMHVPLCWFILQQVHPRNAKQRRVLGILCDVIFFVFVLRKA